MRLLFCAVLSVALSACAADPAPRARVGVPRPVPETLVVALFGDALEGGEEPPPPAAEPGNTDEVRGDPSTGLAGPLQVRAVAYAMEPESEESLIEVELWNPTPDPIFVGLVAAVRSYTWTPPEERPTNGSEFSAFSTCRVGGVVSLRPGQTVTTMTRLDGVPAAEHLRVQLGFQLFDAACNPLEDAQVELDLAVRAAMPDLTAVR